MFKNIGLYKQILRFKNKIVVDISIKDLLKQQIELPSIQRILDHSKVNEIYEYQDNYYKQNNTFNFMGLININCYNDRNYLLDGQHRYNAIKKLHENNYNNQSILLEIINVKNMDELKNNYKLINKNTPLPEFPEDIDNNIPKEVAEYFFKSIPNIWKMSNRPNRPFLNKNHFQEALGLLVKVLNKRGKNVTSGYIRKLITDKNNMMKSWDLDEFDQIKRLKKPDKIIDKCRENRFYLGMYPHISDKYGYDWVKDIIKEQTGISVNIKKKIRFVRKKKTIPKLKREMVWETYMGNTIKELCLCCRVTEIKNTSFQCGHVLAEFNGGTLDIKNLRPICGSCNSSMGTTHMKDFIKTNYPQNLKFFNGIVKHKKKNFHYLKIN